MRLKVASCQVPRLAVAHMGIGTSERYLYVRISINAADCLISISLNHTIDIQGVYPFPLVLFCVDTWSGGRAAVPVCRVRERASCFQIFRIVFIFCWIL